jgi:predicted ATP-binding protein involved in virulence
MGEPVYFLNLKIENYRCFRDMQVLDLSDGEGNWKKWTVILGDNGTGKTSLLEILAGAETQEEKMGEGIVYLPKVWPFGDGGDLQNIRDLQILKDHGSCSIALSILDSNRKRSVETIIYAFKDGTVSAGGLSEKTKELKCFGYGANRKMSSGGLSKLLNNNSETLFNENARLINAEEWLLQLDYAASKESDVKNFAIAKRDQVKKILIDLLPDITDIKFTLPTKKNLNSTIEFRTAFDWVSINQLSLGYETMVAWIVDLAARMFERYPDSPNPLAEPAIVLVDEIDLHLHPKWQREIFAYLSDKFPQTQFIVTAHSPLIVQSAPMDAKIVLLRKEEDHVIIDDNLKSVQNWRIDQILTSDLFGLESARGTETEKKLEERKQLLSKDKLTKEEKDRLNELNSFANRLPVAYNYNEIEAMNIVQEAAEYLKKQKE